MSQQATPAIPVHIAHINFPEFYKELFQSEEAANDFYSQVACLPATENTAKVILPKAREWCGWPIESIQSRAAAPLFKYSSIWLQLGGSQR